MIIDYTNKIVIIIFLATLIIVPIVFNGSIDEFSPKHMAVIHETSQYGYLSDSAKSLFPGFIALGSIINLLSCINARDLLFYPIQLIPNAIIFFYLCYRFSKSYILSALLAFNEMLTGTSGTMNVFLWPHGIGNILFCISLILIMRFLDNKNLKAQFDILIIIVGISLIYISYNLAANILLLFFAMAFYYMVVFCYHTSQGHIEHQEHVLAKNFFALGIITLIVELGLFNFVYQVFLPSINNANELQLSTIDKLLASYLSIVNTPDPILDLFIVKPTLLFPLGLIKQGSLMISALITFILVIKKVKLKKELGSTDNILLSIIIASILIALIRLPLGDNIFTAFSFSGEIAVLWLYYYSRSLTKFVAIIVAILLITTPCYYYEMYSHNLINMDNNEYININCPSKWLYQYEDKDNATIASDELTKNIVAIYLSMERGVLYSNITQSVNIVTADNIFFLTQKPYQRIPLDKYFLINYNLNRLCIQNWIYLKSWAYSKPVINNNKRLNKIYESQHINVYFPKNSE